jgi:hypothetical protein
MLDKLNKLPKKELIKIIINLQNYLNKDSLINKKTLGNINIPKDKPYYWTN